MNICLLNRQDQIINDRLSRRAKIEELAFKKKNISKVANILARKI